MKIKTLGDLVVNIKQSFDTRQIQIVFQDKPWSFREKPFTPVSKPVFDFDLVNLDVVDEVVDTVSLSGRSLMSGAPDTLFSKDVVKISLGDKDTLVVEDFESDSKSTQIDVLLGKGEQSLNISDMDLRRQWYTYHSDCIGDIREAFKDISTINVRQLDPEDHVVFNNNTQDIRFIQGSNGIRVDVIEQGGSFRDPGDYLGRLNFIGADMAIVKEAFHQEMHYNI